MSAAITKLVPLGNRVLLRHVEAERRHGVRIPTNSPDVDEHTQECEIVACPFALPHWEVARRHTIQYIQPGDHVYLARHKGYKIETSAGEELYCAEVDDILAVVVVPMEVTNGDQPETH